MKKKVFLALLACTVFLCSGCGKSEKQYVDGYYTAQQAEYSHGWKEFVTICISNGELVSVEYNAKNSSGYIKSWDIAYMRNMGSLVGTYPNQYTRTYGGALMDAGSVEGVTAIAGASSSHSSFQKLAAQALENAKTGDTSVAIVDTTK